MWHQCGEALQKFQWLLTRERRIKGQAEALDKALEQELECAAILQQIVAVRGAISGLMIEVLQGHIRERLGANAGSPKQRSEDLDQIIALLRPYLR